MPDESNEIGRPAGGDTAALAAAIERISADLSIVLRDQELNRSLIEEIRSQLSVIRQVIDYVLFVSPEQAKDENDLYPFSTWLSGRLEKIIAACERRDASGLQAEHREIVSRERSGLADEIGELGAGLRESLEQVNQQLQAGLSALMEGQDRLVSQTERVVSQISEIQIPEPQDRLAAYDDLDLQLSEIKQLIKRGGARSSTYENFFYGLVIFILLINMLLLLWIRIGL